MLHSLHIRNRGAVTMISTGRDMAWVGKGLPPRTYVPPGCVPSGVERRSPQLSLFWVLCYWILDERCVTVFDSTVIFYF